MFYKLAKSFSLFLIVFGLMFFVLTAGEANALTSPCCVIASYCNDGYYERQADCTNAGGRWNDDCSSLECAARIAAEEDAASIQCCYNSGTHQPCQEVAGPSTPCPSGLPDHAWVRCSDASMDSICRPPAAPAFGCCIPSCTVSIGPTCSADSDYYSPNACTSAANASTCPGAGGAAGGAGGSGAGGAVPEIGTAVPAGTGGGALSASAGCCVIGGETCQTPTVDINTGNPTCARGSFSLQPCSEIDTCRTVNQLQATPAATPRNGLRLPNPLGTANIFEIIGRLIKILSGAVGGIALLMFIYGGLQWMTSAGNPEKIKKGQDIVLWAVIGMFLMFSSFFIVRYFLLGLTTGAAIP